VTARINPAPVRRAVTVRAPQTRAFEVFTAGLHRWWPTTHSIGKSPIAKAVMEPRAGGRWYEIGQDGSECDWGRVIAWEPPARLLLAWQITGKWQYDPEVTTEVEVRFTPEGGDSTRVELEHRNLERLGAEAEAMRAAFESDGGWGHIMERFAQTVHGEPL
jgi:hypothetical protein